MHGVVECRQDARVDDVDALQSLLEVHLPEMLGHVVMRCGLLSGFGQELAVNEPHVVLATRTVCPVYRHASRRVSRNACGPV